MIDYKALKGDPTDNIPGVPGRGREDRGQADPRRSGRSTRCTSAIDEVKPEKLRDKLVEHREPVLESRELIDDRARPAASTLDLEAARLGDYDRETVVRLFREYEFRTLIERLPPLHRGAARGRDRARCASCATAGFGPRPRASAGGRGRSRAARPVDPGAASSCRWTSTSSRAAVARRPRAAAAAAPSRRRRRPSRHEPRRSRPHPATCRPRWRPRSSTPAASRSRTRPASRRWSHGCASRPSVGVALVVDDPRPLARDAAGARRRRRRTAASSRRTVPRPSTRLRHLLEAAAAPARRPRGQAAPRPPDSARTPAAAPLHGRLRHADRGLPPQRRAAQPDDRRRRRRAPRPRSCRRRPPACRARPAPASRRSSALAVRPSLDAAPRATTAWTGCSRSSSCR